MKSVLRLCLLASAIFLTACSGWWKEEEAPPVIVECVWTEEIRFHPGTKEWLAGIDWPATAYADFNQIGDHNELRQLFCPPEEK